MGENYLTDKLLIHMTEEEEKKEILRNIINTRAALTNANKNFEFADTNDLIDYYIYRIKSIQAQLDSLIKLAKVRGIEMEKLA
ncbi:putative uncharacterized protein [Clostridium sp. CAG:793]|jgi:hypothetical protein|nr:putative uncharacterized protein [Clostridium sp. CAG:793]